MLRFPRSLRERSLLLLGLGTLGTVISVLRFGMPESWAQGAVMAGYLLMVLFGAGGLVLRGSDPAPPGGRRGDDASRWPTT